MFSIVVSFKIVGILALITFSAAITFVSLMLTKIRYRLFSVALNASLNFHASPKSNC